MVLAIIHHTHINLGPNTRFRVLSSVLISHFQVTPGVDSVYISVACWVYLRQKCLYEHKLQLSDYNV